MTAQEYHSIKGSLRAAVGKATLSAWLTEHEDRALDPARRAAFRAGQADVYAIVRARAESLVEPLHRAVWAHVLSALETELPGSVCERPRLPDEWTDNPWGSFEEEHGAQILEADPAWQLHDDDAAKPL